MIDFLKFWKGAPLSSSTVNLVMDKIAKRPRGFAFLHYETEEESKNAIEGMHGKVDLINAKLYFKVKCCLEIMSNECML